MTADRPVCSVEECAKPALSATRRLCSGHYMRVYRNGSTGTGPVRSKNPGASCSVDGCDALARNLGLCLKHDTRRRRHGDVHHVGAPPVRRGSDHPSWTGDEASYTAVHRRLRDQRGPATDHKCAFCGGPAFQWAYSHADRDQKTSSLGPYSTKLWMYLPLCVPCHKRFDLDVLRGAL